MSAIAILCRGGDEHCRVQALIDNLLAARDTAPAAQAAKRRCTRASRRRSVRPGTRIELPSGSCATWPGVWSMRNRASRAHPGGAGRDPHPSASACRTNSGARFCTNIIENAIGTVRQVTLVKRWRNAEMAQMDGGPEDLPVASRPGPYSETLSRSTSRRSAIETIEGSIASSTSDAGPTNFNRDRVAVCAPISAVVYRLGPTWNLPPPANGIISGKFQLKLCGLFKVTCCRTIGPRIQLQGP